MTHLGGLGGAGAAKSWAGRVANSFWPVAAALLSVRILFDSRCNLVPDEAYYWVWSRHLSTGYFDHPPMIAWLIWLSTHLVGNTELGVRLPAAVMSVGALIVLYLLAARLLRDARAVGYLLLIWICGPLLPAIGTIHTPDVSAIFFSMCALACMTLLLAGGHAGSRIAVEANTTRPGRTPSSIIALWLLFGLFSGLALLSKYTSILLPAAVAIALLTSRSGRLHLAQPWPYLSALAALAVFSPVIHWNQAHHWASFEFQLHHGAGGRLTENVHGPIRIVLVRLKGFAEFAGGQALVFTPVLFLMGCLLIVANFSSVLPWRRGGGREAESRSGEGMPLVPTESEVSDAKSTEVWVTVSSGAPRTASAEADPAGLANSAAGTASAEADPTKAAKARIGPGWAMGWLERLERAGKLQRLGDAEWMLLWCGTLPLLFFGWAATRSHGEINWPAFAYFPLSLLIARYLSENWRGYRLGWLRIGCQVALGFTIAVHLVAIPAVQQGLRRFVRLPHQLTDLWGWPEFGRELTERARGAPVVCNRHQDAGEAAFYMRGQPEVWRESPGSRLTAFDYFGEGRPDYAHTPRIVFVGDDVQKFQQQFHYPMTVSLFRMSLPAIDERRVRLGAIVEK